MSEQGLMSDVNQVDDGDNEMDMYKIFMKSPEIQDDMGLTTATSFLSVGAGSGNLEELIIGLCPNLKKATLMDCDEEQHRILTNKFKKVPNVEVTCINSLFESYEAPSEGFDLVFMSDCFGFFQDIEKQFARALAMVKKGGKLVSTLATPGAIELALGKVLGSYVKPRINERFAESVSKCRLPNKEKHMGYEWDFSKFGGDDVCARTFSFIANNPVTSKEAVMILKEMEKDFQTGTQILPMDNTIYVIAKE